MATVSIWNLLKIYKADLTAHNRSVMQSPLIKTDTN
jgi:hypothetical protein